MAVDDRTDMSFVGEMTEVEIDLQVRRAAQALIEASLNGDVEAVLASYRPDAPFIEQGRIVARFDELEDAIRDFFRSYRVTENTLSDIRVEILGPKAAILTAQYSFSAVDSEGATMASAGAWSAVFVHDLIRWRVVAPHQSSPSPQSQAAT